MHRVTSHLSPAQVSTCHLTPSRGSTWTLPGSAHMGTFYTDSTSTAKTISQYFVLSLLHCQLQNTFCTNSVLNSKESTVKINITGDNSNQEAAVCIINGVYLGKLRMCGEEDCSILPQQHIRQPWGRPVQSHIHQPLCHQTGHAYN